jgi:predicted membrane channel-forming protein YqfA (hemolysin III family)
MDIKYRRAIGLVTTLVFIVVYVVFATILGSFILNKQIWVKIPFFIIIGTIWVIPLRPLYMWMSPKEHELPKGEKPPLASALKRNRK